MKNPSPTPKPYGSADDLPSIVEMREQLRGAKVITRLIAHPSRSQVVEVEKQLNRIVQLVDDFYSLLGPRNWVFPDNLSTDEVEALLSTNADEAEQKFVALYSVETLRRLVWQLNRHPEMQVRLELVRLALDDYEAGRYYSTVLVLLSVMDGFVNDVDQAHRRGLHAREPSEMVAWDSFTGHHMGLANAHLMYKKTTRKTTTYELFELQRHGIVHGMQLNYNHVIVAAKAWNRLFAVTDWATSLQRQAVVPPPKPTMRGIMKQLAVNAENKKALAVWRPSKLVATDTDFANDQVVLETIGFLEAWRCSNYGRMAQRISAMVAEESVGKTAGMLRLEYDVVTLTDFEIHVVDHEAAAACEVDVTVTVDGTSRPGRMRWIRETTDGELAMPIDSGEWKLLTWGPIAIFNRAIS